MLIFSKKNLVAFYLIPILSWSAPAFSKELNFEGKGRPGQQTSGESRGQCPPKSIDLTALMPDNNVGKTVQEHPTFWVYVPYTNHEVTTGEFSLQDENRKDLYRAAFVLSNTPGFMKVTLPKSVPLEKNQTYRWYFKLYCLTRSGDAPKSSSPAFVQGWIERIEVTNQGESTYGWYAENQIWYDAISKLANLRMQNPQDTKLASDWRDLLGAKGVNLSFNESDVFAGTIELPNSLP